MIQVIQGFKLSTRDPVDNRILLSKDEMTRVNDNQMPDKYFAMCKEDGNLYVYDKSNEVDETTGKFRIYEQFIVSVDAEDRSITFGA